MATITVGTSAQLAQALSEVSSGDTIVLADGNYGDMTIATDFPSNVTITAANPLGATFGSLSVTGSNLTFDGVSLTGRLVVSDAQHVAIVNSKLGSWSDVRYSQDVTLKGNDVPGSIQIDTVDTFARGIPALVKPRNSGMLEQEQKGVIAPKPEPKT